MVLEVAAVHPGWVPSATGLQLQVGAEVRRMLWEFPPEAGVFMQAPVFLQEAGRVLAVYSKSIYELQSILCIVEPYQGPT